MSIWSGWRVDSQKSELPQRLQNDRVPWSDERNRASSASPDSSTNCARPPAPGPTRPADLAAPACDASSLPGARPDAVVWPLSTDDVVAVVKLAAAHAIPLTARGAGSSLEGNPIPVRGGIVLDCARM